METNYLQKVIKEAHQTLINNDDSNENPRVKAIVKTKLEEAYMWADKLYAKENILHSEENK